MSRGTLGPAPCCLRSIRDWSGHRHALRSPWGSSRRLTVSASRARRWLHHARSSPGGGGGDGQSAPPFAFAFEYVRLFFLLGCVECCHLSGSLDVDRQLSSLCTCLFHSYVDLHQCVVFLGLSLYLYYITLLLPSHLPFPLLPHLGHASFINRN